MKWCLRTRGWFCLIFCLPLHLTSLPRIGESWDTRPLLSGKLSGKKSPSNRLRKLLLFDSRCRLPEITVQACRRVPRSGSRGIRVMGSRCCASAGPGAGLVVAAAWHSELRMFEAMMVTEPRAGESSWQGHYFVGPPSLTCDNLNITGTKGAWVRGAPAHFAVAVDDRMLTDRGYSKAWRIRHPVNCNTGVPRCERRCAGLGRT